MTLFIEFVNSVSGLVSAIGTLLVGIGAFLTACHKRKGRGANNIPNSWLTERLLWGIGIVCTLFSVGIFTVHAIGSEPQPKNVELTTKAWEAFNAQNYSDAIFKAQECVDEFHGAADREQAELVKQKIPIPPKGRVSETEKKVIFARGLLNDVATCYYIIGRSAEYLGRKDMAIDAYAKASLYTYARTWDPKGWFWSPSETAGDRISSLK